MDSVRSRWAARGRAAGALLVAGLAVTGCGSSGQDTPAAPPPAAPGGPPPGPPQGPANGQGPLSPPAGPPAVADGARQCVTGNCEISVSGPLALQLTGQGGGITTLSVERADPDGLIYRAVSGGGSSSGNLQPGCMVSLSRGGQRSVCSGDDFPALPARQAGVLTMQVLRDSDGGLRLRLVSG